MSETPQTESTPKLRWHQYRLWHLFVVTAMAAVACSWCACKMLEAQRQREAVEAIRESGGIIMIDYEPEYEPGEPRPLVTYDSEMVTDANQLGLVEEGRVIVYFPDPEGANRVLNHLANLPHLREILLEDKVPEDAVQRIRSALPNCKIKR